FFARMIVRHVLAWAWGIEMLVIDIEIGRTTTGGRTFPVAFRIAFVEQWDLCTDHGAKVRLLREHNLAKSTVRNWLRSRDAGEYKAQMASAAEERSLRRMENFDRAEFDKLRKENRELKRKLAQSEAVQEILGKAYELLEGITTSSPDEDPTEIPVTLLSASEYALWLERNKLS
ncbi:hypothetical protein, partial [Rhodococcus sp. MALMAid1271]|uniref:hypothetical protein n=1 Tax=Rhodococcus sp. MALMAid1271 TaxID=3411744 RepID=UPI003BA37233